MAWWIWVLFGFLLLAVEILSIGIHIGFFGAGAIVVGVLVALGLLDPIWSQWLAFTVVSTASLVLFRRPLLKRFGVAPNRPSIDTLEGESALALEEIGVDAIGRAELRGTSWSARNVGPHPLAKGTRCRVRSVEGLTLHIEPV
jgi:inner membrane protein